MMTLLVSQIFIVLLATIFMYLLLGSLCFEGKRSDISTMNNGTCKWQRQEDCHTRLLGWHWTATEATNLGWINPGFCAVLTVVFQFIKFLSSTGEDVFAAPRDDHSNWIKVNWLQLFSLIRCWHSYTERTIRLDMLTTGQDYHTNCTPGRKLCHINN